jgi:hypothetical protein
MGIHVILLLSKKSLMIAHISSPCRVELCVCKLEAYFETHPVKTEGFLRAVLFAFSLQNLLKAGIIQV